MQKILAIDLANSFWLARGKHTHENSLAGGWAIVQQWLYTINLWIKTHQPTSIVFLGDGYPKWRYDIYKDYKAGRAEARDKDPLTEDFVRQKSDIKKLIRKVLPVYYLFHEHLEADDIFYIVCKTLNDQKIDCEIIGISTDDDWRQMMCTYDNVKIWQPIKKSFKEKPNFDFIKYKAVMGDASDNIKGFKGIGPVRTKRIIESNESFDNWYNTLSDEHKEQYHLNLRLVDSSNINQEHFDFIVEHFRNYEIPQFLSGFLKTYCVQRQIFRYLKNFDQKAENFNSLNAITYPIN